MSAAERFGNPFPPTAVARLTPDLTVGLTVSTDAVRKVNALAERYLETGRLVSRDDVGRKGNVLAIVGDYGTGKTHLALQLLRRLTAPEPGTDHPPGLPRVSAFYLDAPGDSFLALYRERFITRLSRDEVGERVAEYYADIVAAELETTSLTEVAARGLKERTVQAQTLVDQLGLMASDYRVELDRRLSAVTERTDFGTALALFLRPEFKSTVWDWLAGGAPEAVLRERGITETIDTDGAALEALGVFALLYGAQGHRFVLVVDEIERILSPTAGGRPDDETVAAFKRLLEIVGATGALLVLCGLPEFLEALPQDAVQRIPSVIRPTQLSAEDTLGYIEDSQEAAFGERRARPFSLDIAQYLAELAGGNPRRVIRLCYHVYDAAMRAGTDVTRAMVREAARGQFEILTEDEVEQHC